MMYLNWIGYVCFVVSLFSVSLSFSAQLDCPRGQCIAVVDAGNSGSRLHIYRYDENESHAPVHIQSLFSKTLTQGLASVELRQTSINRYLSQLFSDIDVTDMPVYFYATSGMRMLSFSRQQIYYAKLAEWFSKQPQWHLVEAKTLQSREEALYGWLSVNYTLGRFNAPSSGWVSVIDTGSASVQIAVPLKTVQGVHPEDYVNIEVYGQHVSLFTHGFLGLGQDEMRSQYFDEPACFPKHYPLPNGSFGLGEFVLCQKRVTPLINDIHQVKDIIAPVLAVQSPQSWYLIGGLSYMVQERPFAFENHVVTGRLLAEKANQQVCQQDWAILSTLYPKNNYLFANCLSSVYLYSLLVEGFGVGETESIHYISNKVSLNDWTLGVVISRGISYA